MVGVTRFELVKWYNLISWATQIKELAQTSFYLECVSDYHKTAKSLGYANRDLIFIPELGLDGMEMHLWQNFWKKKTREEFS